MSDEELIARLRGWARDIQTGSTAIWAMGQDLKAAADRIEALTKERDQHWDGFVHWRKEADDRSEQLAAARRDAVEAEAYAEELEKELNTCRMAQAVMDNTVADLEDKLAKAAAFLEEIAITGDWFVSDMNDLIKELKGESQDGMV